MTEQDIKGNILAIRSAIEEKEGKPTGSNAVIYDAAFALIEGFLCNVARIAEATESTGKLTKDYIRRRNIEYGRW